jgi:hypothetical protein
MRRVARDAPYTDPQLPCSVLMREMGIADLSKATRVIQTCKRCPGPRAVGVRALNGSI